MGLLDKSGQEEVDLLRGLFVYIRKKLTQHATYKPSDSKLGNLVGMGRKQETGFVKHSTLLRLILNKGNVSPK